MNRATASRTFSDYFDATGSSANSFFHSSELIYNQGADEEEGYQTVGDDDDKRPPCNAHQLCKEGKGVVVMMMMWLTP